MKQVGGFGMIRLDVREARIGVIWGRFPAETWPIVCSSIQ